MADWRQVGNPFVELRHGRLTEQPYNVAKDLEFALPWGRMRESENVSYVMPMAFPGKRGEGAAASDTFMEALARAMGPNQERMAIEAGILDIGGPFIGPPRQRR